MIKLSLFVIIVGAFSTFAFAAPTSQSTAPAKLSDKVSAKNLAKASAKTPNKAKYSAKKAARSAAASEEIAAAATTTPQVALISNKTAWLKSHLSIAGFISSANAIKSTGNAKLTGDFNTIKGDGEVATDSGMGIDARITDYKWGNIAWQAGLSLETSRELSGGNIGSLRLSAQGSKPSFRPVIASGGISYQLNETIYFPVALNYALYTMKTDGAAKDFTLTPQLGYQYGIGFHPKKLPIALELVQREVRYQMEIRGDNFKADFGDSVLAGYNIQGRYSF